MNTISQYKMIRKVSNSSFLTVTLFILLLNNVFAAGQKMPDLNKTNIKTKVMEGEILVRFNPDMTMEDQQLMVESFGGESVTEVAKKLKISKVKLQQGDDIDVALQAYQSHPSIEYAQPNYVYYTNALPNDTNFNQLWGLKNSGQTIIGSRYNVNNPGTVGYDIDAESAWDQITDCRSTTVAVLDTGINYTHEDLDGNMWDGSGKGFPNHGFDFIDNDNDPMPTGAAEDHATHVAGTIGAMGNNNTGVTGICWQASIMSVRVLGANGSGTTAGIIQGIEFASDNGASVINMSLGGESPFDTLFSNAISYARDRDVVVVVAAGNGGRDGTSDDNDGPGDDGNANTTTYPCSFSQENLLCVAAIDQSYQLASFSNFGRISVDVAAPGTNILSSYAGQKIAEDFSNAWVINNGWSAGICETTKVLSNSANWCIGGTYTANVNDRAYKTFNLTGAIAAELQYFRIMNTEANFDFFSTAMKSNGGNPFNGGINLFNNSGSSSQFVAHDISSCNTSTCSLGFRLTTDANIENSGVGIFAFSIETLQLNSSSYYPSDGTSMSSPHVAGIATMVRAFNPDYSYAQTVEAIKNGGESVAALSGITVTGRAANAMGAISYITQPSGLTAVIE